MSKLVIHRSQQFGKSRMMRELTDQLLDGGATVIQVEHDGSTSVRGFATARDVTPAKTHLPPPDPNED